MSVDLIGYLPCVFVSVRYIQRHPGDDSVRSFPASYLPFEGVHTAGDMLVLSGTRPHLSAGTLQWISDQVMEK